MSQQAEGAVFVDADDASGFVVVEADAVAAAPGEAGPSNSADVVLQSGEADAQVIEGGPPGASAYEVWLQLPGNAGLSPEDFLESLRGPPGPAGITAAGLAVPFSFGDASPRVAFPTTSRTLLQSVSILLVTPFDGMGAGVTVGLAGSPDLFLHSSQIDVGVTAEFSAEPNVILNPGEDVQISISPGVGATRGDGFITIQRRIILS